jgi:hypothetical protein
MYITRYSYEEATPIITRLQQHPLSRLDLLFKDAGVPTFEEIEGRTAGGWLARSPKDYWWARLFIKVFLDSPWARWSGKGFFTPFDKEKRGRGANLFRNQFKPIRYPLETYIKVAEVDDNLCLTLEYPFGSLMYGLIDDVRKIEDGVFLGQMQYKFPWQKKRLFLGYFVLCALQPD